MFSEAEKLKLQAINETDCEKTAKSWKLRLEIKTWNLKCNFVTQK